MNDQATTSQENFSEMIQRLQALLGPSRPGLRLQNILVPLNFSERSLRALPYARFLFQQFGSTVTLFHAVHLNIVGEDRGVPLLRFLDEMISAAERILREVSVMFNLTGARVVVRVGDPVSAILQEADASDTDLIILSRHERVGLQKILRPSIGKKIVGRARCPTLVA